MYKEFCEQIEHEVVFACNTTNVILTSKTLDVHKSSFLKDFDEVQLKNCLSQWIYVDRIYRLLLHEVFVYANKGGKSLCMLVHDHQIQ